ncbi:MAG: DUF2382 domain-containing protein [Cyanomargarita calcarea GSE-NOS-MK-12-04C]|jgi:uncharacterized protein (TIGR02271 family)|uniref:DUF2382 domain-containing protein n=1 Tax=Cyanomargarita calcarea GSE-NOS-MK-12-04C TaxID=2839659 RepID=A0A951QK79_9CYAN|nr:DUF2382 domain-containing protein [Cyanomargarita calcarea GSE-NOS-MK-12-04C]
MPLVKIADYYPDYRNNHSDVDDVQNFDVYAERNEKVGTVHNILVDSVNGNFRYLVVDTGFWIFGKKVLLPVGRADIRYTDKLIYARGLTKEQVEELPNYDELEKIDYDYEEQVRGVYRGSTATSGLNQPASYDRASYNYQQDSSLYDMPSSDGQTLKLYEERLIANKQRQKTGEVSIGKHIETETARVAVPVEKERVVIERNSPTDTRPQNSSSDAFRPGEVARMEIYEETPDIRKEAIVREEVRVKKVVEQDTVQAQEKLRREELDIDSQGLPIVDK